MTFTLIDAGPIIAYYNSRDNWHERAEVYLEEFVGQFATTCPVVAEAMYMLRVDRLAQDELLSDLSKGLYSVIPLEQKDFARIAELNIKYRNLRSDFADLSLIAVSERLEISDIASLDADFDVYRRFIKGKFNQVFPRHV